MFKRKSKNSPAKKQQIDHEQLGRMLTNIYETGYIDRNQAYKTSFLKGMLSGLGGVIGATIVVGLLIWVLSLFQHVPFLDRLYNNVNNTINSQRQ